MRRFSLLILVILGLVGCKDDPPNEIDFGYNYLPLEIGNWVEYDVDSIVFDAFTEQVDTYNFRLRDIIAETFEDLDSRDVYRVEQSYVGGLESDPTYTFRKTYSLVVNGVRAERLDDNLKTVILVFPPRQGATWDGNAFNT